MAELDVADDVVDREQAVVAGDRRLVARRIAGQERALVVGAVDEGVDGVAVGGDGRQAHRAVLVGEVVRRLDAARAAGRRLEVGVVDVRDAERDHLHAVAVLGDVRADLVAGNERAGQDDPDAALLEDVRRAVAHAGLQAGVGHLGEPERADPIGRGLQRVADIKLDVVDAVERHEVIGLCWCDDRLRAHGLHDPPIWRRRQCRSVASRGILGARMDDIDRQIVALLRQDARRSFQSIGLRVSLSAPAVKRRVDRLELDGVIRGYTARVDPGRFGWNTHALVALYCEGRMPASEVREAVERHPEVEAAYTVAGEASAVVHVRARDTAHLEETLERIRDHAGVTRTQTQIVLSTLFERPFEE